jgi:hypothetical protein
MALSKREMNILWLTLAIAGGVVLWSYGLSPLWETYTVTRDELQKEEAKYNSNRDKLKRAKTIEADYQRIEATFPKTEEPGQRADHAFSADVDAAAEAILPGGKRDIQPVIEEEIKGVKGYEFLTLTMTVFGELDKIAQLLKGFDQKGFLIKSISLFQNKGVDNPELKLDLTLARIVKMQEDGDSGPRRPGSRRLTSGGRR